MRQARHHGAGQDQQAAGRHPERNRLVQEHEPENPGRKRLDRRDDGGADAAERRWMASTVTPHRIAGGQSAREPTSGTSG